MKGIQITEKHYGWRIDHEKGGESDITIALGMASLLAMEQGIEDGEFDEELSDLYFLDQSHIYKSGGTSRVFSKESENDPDVVDDSPRITTFSRIF